METHHQSPEGEGLIAAELDLEQAAGESSPASSCSFPFVVVVPSEDDSEKPIVMPHKTEKGAWKHHSRLIEKGKDFGVDFKPRVFRLVEMNDQEQGR